MFHYSSSEKRNFPDDGGGDAFHSSFVLIVILESFNHSISLRLKRNLEAAEERGDELQRLLDASRASENQALSLLRSLQLQNQRNNAEVDETTIRPAAAPSSTSANAPLPPTPPSVNVSRLMEDLAEMEERLLTVESDWMEEKRKRMQLETEIVHLNRENHRLQEDSMAILQSSSSGTNSSCAPSYAETSTAVSLSLSEELLLSSGDYVSHTTSQWNEAWDHSGPLSLIGGPASGETRNKLDEELGSDSSSSGFSEAGIQQHKSTQTGEVENPAPVEEDAQQDYKSLFKEIFAVIKQNL